MSLSKVSPMDWSILRVIHRLGATPQHKLAEHVGRQPSTINGAVRRLLAAGWLEKVGQTGQGRGRPAILLAVNRQVGCFAGIDIGADEMHCALVAADGTLLERASSRLGDDRRLPAIVDQIDLTLRGMLSRVALAIDSLFGVWAGINGAVDDKGVVVTCASLGWHNVPFGAALEQRFACRVLVQGGATAMNAAAEAIMGVGRDADSLVYYHAGRGISTRFVERGQPLAGHSARAGELGHVVLVPGGPRCACGNRGCLEAVASGPAIVAALRKLPRKTLPGPLARLLHRPGEGTVAQIVHAAFSNRPRAKRHPLAQLLQQVTDHLAVGAAMAVAAYDPQILVLGGYLFEDNPSLRTGVERALAGRVLDWDKRDLSVRLGEVLTQNRAVGGAAEVCQRFWANPRGVAVAG